MDRRTTPKDRSRPRVRRSNMQHPARKYPASFGRPNDRASKPVVPDPKQSVWQGLRRFLKKSMGIRGAIIFATTLLAISFDFGIYLLAMGCLNWVDHHFLMILTEEQTRTFHVLESVDRAGLFLLLCLLIAFHIRDAYRSLCRLDDEIEDK